MVAPALSATFVSKPGLVQSPAKKNPNKEVSFVDSFNETYRDYGLDDLCSDSDNTDDEDAPLKRVRSLKLSRPQAIKSRIRVRLIYSGLPELGWEELLR